MRILERRGKYFLLTLAFAIFASLNSGFAQGEMTRKFGLTGSVQGGQTTILVPLWLGDRLTVAPGFSLLWVDGVTTNIGLQVTPRLYLDMDRIAPYITGTVGVRLNMPNAAGDTTDLMFALGFGGEYFINPKFSFGVEALLNGFITDISGADIFSITTATAVHANVYF